MARPQGVVQGARHLMVRWQMTAVSVMLMLLGFGYLAYALDLWLGERMSATAAAAATAAILIVLGLAVIGIASLLGNAAQQRGDGSGRMDPSDVGEIAASLMEIGQKLNIELKSTAKPLALAALLAGCLIGYSPALQKQIAKFLR